MIFEGKRRWDLTRGVQVLRREHHAAGSVLDHCAGLCVEQVTTLVRQVSLLIDCVVASVKAHNHVALIVSIMVSEDIMHVESPQCEIRRTVYFGHLREVLLEAGAHLKTHVHL